MSIAAMLKDPDTLYADMAEYLNSEERVSEGLGHLSYTNGLLTAVIVGPEFIPQSEWLPRIANLLEEGASPEDIELLKALMLLDYGKILESLKAKNQFYEPYFWEDWDERVITKDWAEGFLEGRRLRGDAWAQVSEGNNRSLAAIYVLLQDDEINAKLIEAGLDPEELFEAAVNEIPSVVQSLFDRWAWQRPKNQGTFGQPGKKIGRNDPCPCGSGRKYKKCCLN